MKKTDDKINEAIAALEADLPGMQLAGRLDDETREIAMLMRNTRNTLLWVQGKMEGGGLANCLRRFRADAKAADVKTPQ